MGDEVKILVVINAATLTAIIVCGYRVIRFINRIEFKTDLMWEDYESRMNRKRIFAMEKD